MDLSVVLITKNAENRLRACLQSIAWADEIIVFDDESIDRTREIASEFTSRIYSQPRELLERHLGNFDVMKNLGFDEAKSRWVLSLDADEEVSAALRTEISTVCQFSTDKSYFIPRKNFFWGKPLRLLGEDYQLRLFPKGRVYYEGVALDSRPVVRGATAHLSQPLIHHQVDSLRQLIEKFSARTAQRAEVLLDESRSEKKKVVYSKPLSLFYYLFRYYYLKQQSYRDGALGLLAAAVYAADPAVSYLRFIKQHRRAELRPQSPAGQPAGIQKHRRTLS